MELLSLCADQVIRPRESQTRSGGMSVSTPTQSRALHRVLHHYLDAPCELPSYAGAGQRLCLRFRLRAATSLGSSSGDDPSSVRSRSPAVLVDDVEFDGEVFDPLNRAAAFHQVGC